MAVNDGAEPLTVGIVGAGAMGRGIAQVAATGGVTALIHDSAAGAADAAVDFAARMLDRQAEKGRMTPDEAATAKARLVPVAGLEALADCDVVVEAIVEDLAIKRELFRTLEEIVTAEAVIASNTSSLRIASIASACRRRERIAGMHFFNPVPLMKLVEVVAAPETSTATTASLVALGRRLGRVPVVVKDAPGFLVNLGGSAYTTEGLRIVSEGVATPAQVDAVMRDAAGFRMGPFELMDLTGIDVNFPVRQIIHAGYFYDRRLATSPLHESLAQSGRFGRKTGGGFFDYDGDGKKIAPSADYRPDVPPAAKLVPAEPDGALVDLLERAGAEIATADDGASPLVCAPRSEDCTAVAVRLGLAPDRLVAVDLSGGLDKRITVMAAPGADEEVVGAVAARLMETGAAVTRIKDSPAFIAPRIRAMIANLGCEMAQIGIAAPADIDTAMKLGLNYPEGPLELAEAMGARQALDILAGLQEITGDDRYRPSLWLRRRALLGLPIHTPD